jgi:precorrin-6A/cobalt-precorrin-6A reductase
MFLFARGPFQLASERHILRQHRIEVMVSKASGGAATEPKLIAAREADLPVIMIRRPPPPRGPLVERVEAALEWLGLTLRGMGRGWDGGSDSG